MVKLKINLIINFHFKTFFLIKIGVYDYFGVDPLPDYINVPSSLNGAFLMPSSEILEDCLLIGFEVYGATAGVIQLNVKYFIFILKLVMII